MRLPFDLIIIDTENNQNCPVTGKSGTIIEIGAVKFLRDGGIHPVTFSELVNPYETLGKIQSRIEGVETITDLTGITQDMVDNAGDLEEVIERFRDWCYSGSSNIVLCGWGGDPSWLRAECEDKNIPYNFRGKTLDIKSFMVILSTFFNKKIKSDGLGSMMRGWEVEWEDDKGPKHRALADAYHTAKLLKTVWDYWISAQKNILKAQKKIGFS